MSKNWIVVVFLLLWNSSYACNPNEFCVIDENEENTRNLLTSIDYFTTQLIQKFIYDPKVDTNVVISPTSIYTVLTLILFGAAGDTQKELIKSLKFPETDMKTLQKYFGDILIATDVERSKLVGGKEDIFLEAHIVQGLFFQKDYTLVDAYSQYLKELNIKTEPVDFVNNLQDAANAIMKWIQDSGPKSNSISFSDSISDKTRMYISNMFYFSANWDKNIFLDIVPGPVPFNTLDKKKIDVEMIKATSSLLFYDNKKSYSAVEVPYAMPDFWQDFTAIFILPNKDVDCIKFVTTFTMDIIDEFYEKATLTDVDVQIPKLSYSYSIELNAKLEELGIKLLFKKADLSNMFKNMKKEEDIGIPLSQTCEITVNEYGTKAQTSTKPAVAEANTATTKNQNPPKFTPFVADRPFLMLIRNTNTSGIAFATFYHKVENGANISAV